MELINHLASPPVIRSYNSRHLCICWSMHYFNPLVIMGKRDHFIFVRRAVIIQGLDGLGSEKNCLWSQKQLHCFKWVVLMSKHLQVKKVTVSRIPRLILKSN